MKRNDYAVEFLKQQMDSSSQKPVLLIIDDDEVFRESLERVLRPVFAVRCAGSTEEIEACLWPPPDVVLLDLCLSNIDPSNRDGLKILESFRERIPLVPVLVATAYGDDHALVKDCMRRGAVDFLDKATPDIHEVKTRLVQAIDYSLVRRRAKQLERDYSLVQPREIVGSSKKIEEIRLMIEAVARDANVTVLLRGESGTGKELVARAIHASGRRNAKPIVPVMLNALPQAMVEAELFGYEPGAFTDAKDRHIGYIEQSHGSVLFLDEIGEVDTAVQTKLLRFLEEREFQRLGSTLPVRVDVQIVAATNADLYGRVQHGLFREDLYFRLKVHEIILPPLRERIEDIPLLVDHFLHVFKQQGRRVHKVSSEAVQLLQSFDWPGNIRQLRNSIESSLFWAETRGHDCIWAEDLPSDTRDNAGTRENQSNDRGLTPGFSIHEALARTELSYIDKALQVTSGKKVEVWKLVGYHDRFALNRRVRRLLEDYPEMRDEFPRVSSSFQNGSGRRKD